MWRQSNGFPTRVIIYTDEHGEARANWLPGLGADFFNDVFVDMNGGCDLEGLHVPGPDDHGVGSVPVPARRY